MLLSTLGSRPLEHFRCLAEAGEALLSSLDEESTIRTISRLAVPMLGDWCALFIIEDRGALRLAGSGHVELAREGHLRRFYRNHPPQLDDDEGPGWVLRTGEPELLPPRSRLQQDERRGDERETDEFACTASRGRVTVPLVARGRMLAALVLGAHGGGRTFQADDLALAQEFARRAALALDNARLHQALAVRGGDWTLPGAPLPQRPANGSGNLGETLHEAQVLIQVVLSIGGDLDRQLRLERVMDAARDLLKAAYAQVALVDSTRRWVEIVATRGKEGHSLGVRLPMGEGLIGRVAQYNRSFRVPDMQRDPRVIHLNIVAEEGTHGWLGVPLADDLGAFGVLCVLSERTDDFDEADERRLQALAALASIALHESRVHQLAKAEIEVRRRAEQELWARARQQAVVADLGLRALGGVDPRTLMHEAATLVSETLDVPSSAVFQLDDERKSLTLLAGHGWPSGMVGTLSLAVDASTLVGYTILRDTPVVVDDMETETRFPVGSLVRTLGTRSSLAVTIRGSAGACGVLSAFSSSRHRFTEDDVNFAQAVANMIGSALERAHAEAALHQREQELKALVEHAPDNIYRFDRDLRHVYVNLAVARSTGKPADSFIGRTVAEMGFPDAHVASWDIALRQVFATGSELMLEFVLPTPAGDRYYQSRLSPELGRDGKVAYVVGVSRDISDRKRAEAERATVYSALMEREAHLRELIGRVLLDREHDDQQRARTEELNKLSPREREVLRLVAVGRTNGQIARQLGLSPGTVKNHVSHTLAKLGAVDRTQAAVRAVDLGLIRSGGL